MNAGPSRYPLVMIVAAAENDVIGYRNGLPWRVSADLKRFKRLTMGHHLIMGRKTHESLGRLLPGRTTVIVTRQSDYAFEGARIAHSLDEAIAIAGDDPSPFLIGGSELYRSGLPRVGRLYLTRIHAEIVGDAWLPALDWNDWVLIEEERFPADERNEHDYTFQEFARR